MVATDNSIYISDKAKLKVEQLMQDALRSVVRAALQEAASPRGLPGKHHFYITFRTHAAGVTIPDHLKARYGA